MFVKITLLWTSKKKYIFLPGTLANFKKKIWGSFASILGLAGYGENTSQKTGSFIVYGVVWHSTNYVEVTRDTSQTRKAGHGVCTTPSKRGGMKYTLFHSFYILDTPASNKQSTLIIQIFSLRSLLCSQTKYLLDSLTQLCRLFC